MLSGRNVIAIAAVLATPTAALARQRVDLPARDRTLEGEPTRAWAVGTDEGESWEMFANVSQLVFDRNDNLYVLDQGNSRVLVFDARGRFLRQFGKQGGGPGEFQFPGSISIDADGSIVVFDMARRGYSVFDADGTYREHIPLPQGFGMPRPDEIRAHPEGGVVVRAMPDITPETALSGEPMASPVYHQRFDEESQPRRIHEFTMPAPRVMSPPASGGRQIRMIGFSRPTFAAEPTWGVLPGGGLAISEDDDYESHVTDANGRQQRVLARPFRARPVSRRDQEAARDQRRQELKTAGGPGARFVTQGGTGGRGTFVIGSGSGAELSEEQIEEQVRAMQFAESIPAIRRIVVDPTGRIWVERSPARVGDEPPVDLLSSDGRYIGTIAGQPIPRAVSSSGLAAYVERNELDVEQIVVRRLPATWR